MLIPAVRDQGSETRREGEGEREETAQPPLTRLSHTRTHTYIHTYMYMYTEYTHILYKIFNLINYTT